MEINSGITKNVLITGYERNHGTSEKCISDKNPKGEYDIYKFWYTEDVEVTKEKYTAYGTIGKYFTIGADAGKQLTAELRNAEYKLGATISGSYGKTGELRVYSISTD